MSREPYVGREAQLGQLRSWAADVAATGTGRFVLVVGEAGAGKTRLCSELAALSSLPPSAVAMSRCWLEAGGPPLWPWPDLVAELETQQGVMPELVQAGEISDRFGLFLTVTEQLRAICEVRPAIALVDDLHAANQDVLLLTRFIARSLHRFPLLVIATWRTRTYGERSEDLTVMAREASVIELPPFSADEIATYLASSGHAGATRDEIAALLDCTGGNPMYVAEVVRHRRTDHGATSGGLALALARRVAAIDPRRRRIAGAAGLLGPGATVAATAQVLGYPLADVAETLSDPSIGVTVAANVIRFSHELLGAAFVAAIPVTERQRLHRAARDTITGGDTDRLVRRAHHAVEAAPISPADTAVAVGACIDAADALYRALAYEQAAAWAARATELTSGVADPTLSARALLTHAQVVLACGRLSEARQLFGRAVEPSEAAADARLLALAALGLGGVWVEEERDELSRRRMLNLCRRALAALPADEPLLAARIGVRLAAEHAYDGAAAAGDVAAAVDRVRRLGDPSATAEALSLYHHALLLPGKASARLQVADDLLDVASNPEATVYSLFGLCWRTVDLYHLGDREAERAFFDLRERAAALGSQSVGYIVAVLDVMRCLRRGELERAEALAVDALALGTAAGDADALGYYGAHLLTLRWIQGRVGELLEPVQAVIESSTLRRRDQIYPALLAYAHALRGDHAAARSVLDGLLADGAGSIPEFSTWTGTVGVLVETAAELGDGELALALAEQFAPLAHLPVMPSLAVTCLGPGERVMGRAMTTAGRLDEGIGWLRAALLAARRIGNRPFAVLIRADLAAALRRRAGPGDAETAAGLAASAISEGRELGMAGWVARWDQDGTMHDDHDEVEVLQGTLEREDGTWRVGVGGRVVVVKNMVGMRYMAELVARPDTDIRACDLSAAVFGGGPVDAGPVGPVALDDRARDEYRRRLVQLERELDAADRAGDVDRARRAAHERDVLVATLRRETGLGGRPRRMADDSERCRMRVSKAIHRALERIGRADPAVGRALESRIRTGHVCRYLSDPGQPIAWTVRPAGRGRLTSPD